MRTERAIEKILDYGQLWKNIGEHIILTLVVVKKTSVKVFNAGTAQVPTETRHTALLHLHPNPSTTKAAKKKRQN